MRFPLQDIEVFFPYDSVYDEQFEYMLELKRALDAPGHALLEMPTGTGKTVCLMSLITSYQFAKPEMGKFIYCTRTVPEMVKCVEELKKVIGYRKQCVGERGGKVLALCLSSRRNMCIHERVMEESDREAVDAACRTMTASWVRKRAEEGHSPELCDFFEAYERDGTDAAIPDGIYSLEDLRDLGRERGWCPYFLARHVLKHANVLIYNYQYMLDPKVAGLVSSELEENSVVVFDEAHNIDNVCIEAMSVKMSRPILEASSRSLSSLTAKVNEMKASDAQRLNEEYQRLVSGLAQSGVLQGAAPSAAGESVLANPALPPDILAESVPGNIRQAEHFLVFLRKIVRHLKRLLRQPQERWETPQAFLHELHQQTGLEAKPMRFAYSRLNSLLRTLEVTSLDDHADLSEVADFATLVATYQEGFAVIFEPRSSIIPGLSEPVLELSCLDASVAIKPVFKRFRSVIITSGTLSPIETYPRILDFTAVVSRSLDMSTFRNCISPMIVTHGADQKPISSAYDYREREDVVRNYGSLLADTCRTVPDGLVVFFPSYLYMETIIARWEEMQILQEICRSKLLFIETKDVVETTLALDNFRAACECGRGAVFLSVARGKVAEGIDFDRHLGRAVMMIGVPFQYVKSLTLRARLDFLHTKFQIDESEFITFDAMRQAAQCAGRVIRGKTDYGLMIFADYRYSQESRRNKLPRWIRKFLGPASCKLSTTSAWVRMRKFLRDMAQPVDPRSQAAVLLDHEHILRKASMVASRARAAAPGGDVRTADGEHRPEIKPEAQEHQQGTRGTQEAQGAQETQGTRGTQEPQGTGAPAAHSTKRQRIVKEEELSSEDEEDDDLFGPGKMLYSKPAGEAAAAGGQGGRGD